MDEGFGGEGAETPSYQVAKLCDKQTRTLLFILLGDSGVQAMQQNVSP